ncbi:LysR family transcriptional regulator [Amycolatopsis sp. YIM 10]|uniref:LysR family transcriptional regulator n=1 Tax=Amycolatopsis sp. YIM 10 TaxID=2653857 RepID=UPI00128FD404|nr:LysR family transcriptional regulator [Amycolatopsis sp. YIM 10]QFU90220.1 HTH-type transcriptional regulator CynR [Amycolatopsis sp. YIM 10]
MDVELRHLRALAAIGDHGTITGAALALRLSQPALSRTLAQLERRVGAVLVERTTRSLELTDAGRRLCDKAHGILAAVDDALGEAADRPRELRLGFAWSSLGEHTVPLLRSWRERHPEIGIAVSRQEDPVAALLRGEIDVAVLRETPVDDPALLSEPLFAEPRLAAVAATDPLATREHLTLEDLATRTVALCRTAATTSASMWQAPGPRLLDVAGVHEWLTTIATGAAVGVTAAGTAHDHPFPGVRYLPVPDAGALPVSLASPVRMTHPATRLFSEHLRSSLIAA